MLTKMNFDRSRNEMLHTKINLLIGFCSVIGLLLIVNLGLRGWNMCKNRNIVVIMLCAIGLGFTTNAQAPPAPKTAPT